ncbi:MAG: hypothetical protein ACRD8Z_08520, partial [Nitrososphaeraceae archaeon]
IHDYTCDKNGLRFNLHESKESFSILTCEEPFLSHGLSDLSIFRYLTPNPTYSIFVDHVNVSIIGI